MNNDGNLNSCSRRRISKPFHCDRLHDLPDEILTQILSKLPSKDAVAAQVTSKRMSKAFACLTCLDFDDSPVTQCANNPHHAKHSPIFESFVDNTLRKFSEFEKPLTRFSFRVGGDKSRHFHFLEKRYECEEETCFSRLEPTRLNMWLSYPLAYSSLRELVVSFHVSNPFDFELPAGILTCQSLEVLKLDSNLEIDDNEFPLICLPNLKLLHLRSFYFTTDVFLTRLVTSCPALDDLSITLCSWQFLDHLTISSPSLRNLVLDVWYEFDNNTCIVVIDTPSLQSFDYDHYLASSYNIVHMNALTKACIRTVTQLGREGAYAFFRTQLSLIRAFSHVQYLSLLGHCAENVYFSGELKDQLPVFHALKTLELGAFFHARWDIVLSLFLRRSPLLETLIFPMGLCVDIDGKFICSGLSLDDRKAYQEEAKAWRNDETIPASCMSRLKRIQLNDCYVRNRELNMINFFLRQAPLLKEVAISVHKGFKPMALQRQLEVVPRASSLCSFTTQVMTPKQ